MKQSPWAGLIVFIFECCGYGAKFRQEDRTDMYSSWRQDVSASALVNILTMQAWFLNEWPTCKDANIRRLSYDGQFHFYAAYAHMTGRGNHLRCLAEVYDTEFWCNSEWKLQYLVETMLICHRASLVFRLQAPSHGFWGGHDNSNWDFSPALRTIRCFYTTTFSPSPIRELFCRSDGICSCSWWRF